MKYPHQLCVAILLVLLIFITHVTFYLPNQRVSKEPPPFFYIGHSYHRSHFESEISHNINHNVIQERTDVFQRDNLIYYGSNKEISNRYNSKKIISSFSHLRNKSSVKHFPRSISIGMPKSGTKVLLVFLAHKLSDIQQNQTCSTRNTCGV